MPSARRSGTDRPLLLRSRRRLAIILTTFALPASLAAQPVLAPRLARAPAARAVTPPPASDPTPLLPTAEEWPPLILMPFTGALGAQALGSPTGWARTWAGYGYRLGDQVGFLVIEEGVRRVLTRALPPTAPRASCWATDRSAARNLTVGAGCALWSTVAARPAEGDGWRFNAPVAVSLLAATGTSLAWRPERSDAATARSFLLTRSAIVFGGMAAARLFDDWRHRGEMTARTPVSRAATASAGQLLPHPDDPTKQVEYFVQRPTGTGPWPTVVLLHGHQEPPTAGGQDFVTWGVLEQLARRGYLAVSVSQPGYGRSSGPADFSGPFTQHAVSGVIAALRAEGVIAPDRLLLQGISRGALTAALLATYDSSITGLVLISGLYDLPAWIVAPSSSLAKPGIVASMRAETGGSDAALAERSALQHADRIRAATLILNGARDDRTDPAQARAFADRISQSGGNARAIIYPTFGHQIPVDVRNRNIDPFIDRVLGTSVRSP